MSRQLVVSQGESKQPAEAACASSNKKVQVTVEARVVRICNGERLCMVGPEIKLLLYWLCLAACLFAGWFQPRLISQPTVFFSHNKSAPTGFINPETNQRIGRWLVRSQEQPVCPRCETSSLKCILIYVEPELWLTLTTL